MNHPSIEQWTYRGNYSKPFQLTSAGEGRFSPGSRDVENSFRFLFYYFIFYFF